ncbi:MAG TPA: PAS domain-containing sensor histidine kinase [Polyangia bacterium]|nr:PAS domain-containing sensor histidine kinase [Polyangia bacterium]
MPSDDPAAPAVREALDNAACGLLQTTTDGTFLRVNRLFRQWVGYADDELIGKRRFQDLLTIGGRVFHQTHWAPLLQMQGSISEVKLEIVDRAGTAIPIVVNALRRSERGAIVHEIAAYIARDRDKYEHELVQSRKRLEVLVAEATRLQAEARERAMFAQQMMGIVSHDLRNPLSTIQTGAVLLARGELTAGQQRVLARISSATDRATRLIGDLLDFTQAQLGSGLAVVPQPVDLHAVVAEAVEDLRLAYSGRKIVHESVGAGGCSADANRLAQLVGNLVSNAMTYGAPEAAVRVVSTVDEGALAISVHNQGPPIPPDVLPHIFQPMSRGSEAGRVSRSVGLGLYIVSEIARAHGGTTSVASTVAEGTTFTTVIPRRAPAEG